MKHRLQRVKELIKRELSDLIAREIRFDQLVTIQEVDITPDLKQAHIFVSVLGGPGQAKKALNLLEKKRKDLQYLLSRRVILKFTPQLHFKLDTALERGTRVISIMEDLHIPEDEEILGEAPAKAPEDADLDTDTEDLADEDSERADEDDSDDENAR